MLFFNSQLKGTLNIRNQPIVSELKCFFLKEPYPRSPETLSSGNFGIVRCSCIASQRL